MIYDDISLPPGQLRIRKKGSAGGHNGLKSIISQLGTDEFKRIRIGIGKPEFGNTPDFVLSAPKDKVVYEAWKDGISKACEALECALKNNSFEKAMSLYNK